MIETSRSWIRQRVRGTFIVELLEHFRGRRAELRFKYLNELHANEVAILPYYVANLNIETTYAAITEEYAEFPNLCFVDTLDNVAALKLSKAVTGDLLGGISTENVERIKRQNDRKISVIIGNPPYNANQQNENDNNKNRKYPEIDKRIKATYIKESTAQKTKQYDPYVRFFRWACDRIEDDGIIALITNRSFIDARNFDGFREVAPREFAEALIVDLGGDYKKKGVGGGGNVFGIGTGVAISLWVKKRQAVEQPCRIRYIPSPTGSGEDKLEWLGSSRASTLHWSDLVPQQGYWIDNPEAGFGDALPLVSKNAKAAKGRQERAVFRLFSLGIATNRDEWVYDKHPDRLIEKISFFVDFYESERARWQQAGRPRDVRDWVRRRIKWTSELEALLCADKPLTFRGKRIRQVAYRPFVNQWSYYDHHITHRPYQNNRIYPIAGEWTNSLLIFTGPSAQKPWMVCASSCLADLHYVGGGAGSVCVSRYRYADGQRLDNITDWALAQFIEHYGGKAVITKDHIFAYVYGVLHDPLYRETYALNLKREFPRIPFYPDFGRWRDWGQSLLDLHMGYEAVEPFPLVRTDIPHENVRATGQTPRVVLKADRDNGMIVLDADTQLSGVPKAAWEYKLGNRSALDWVLDQHKEKTPKDLTVREKFNTYRFADYKERVIDLLRRVTTVSVRTVEMVEAMRTAPR